MKTARGNTRKLLIYIGKMQNLIGKATGAAMNDRDPNQMSNTLEPLEEAFNLCLDATGMYEQVIEEE